VLLTLVTPIALGVVGGSAIGTRLLSRIRGSTIRYLFVIVLAMVVIQMLVRGISG
jgi:uncharacterized membrane protein YfcA